MTPAFTRALLARFERGKKAMSKLARIRIAHYHDSGQITVWAYWADGSVTSGKPESAHMVALMSRARRENLPIVEEDWS